MTPQDAIRWAGILLACFNIGLSALIVYGYYRLDEKVREQAPGTAPSWIVIGFWAGSFALTSFVDIFAIIERLGEASLRFSSLGLLIAGLLGFAALVNLARYLKHRLE